MNRVVVRLLVAGIVLCLAPSRSLAQNGYDLFQQALVLERSNGNVADAITLYQRILADHADDRALAARTLVRLGLAHETLGSGEATDAYERVVREYPEQREMVEQARRQLAALRNGPAVPAVLAPARRLISDTIPRLWAAPTKDGEHLLQYDAEKGAFVLEEIATGATRSLTDGGLTFDPAGTVGVWWYDLSNDGRRIAAIVITYTDSTVHNDLRIIDVGSRGTGRSIATWTKQRARLIGWAPDGDKVWVWNMHFDGQADIASVDVDDGTVSVIKTLAYRRHTQPPSLSPDGRFIAYHDAAPGEATDIFIVATDGTQDVRVDYPGPDSKPLFAPDGSGVVFDSERRGERDLWFLPLENGRPAGDPRVVWQDIGAYGEARRFTDNGSLFYYFAQFEFSVYTAALDVNGAGLGEVTMIPPRYRQMNAVPAWSPDGRYVAHRRGRRQVVVREFATGAEREFSAFEGTMLYGTIDWCDDRTVVVTGGAGSENVGQSTVTYRIDIVSGEIVPVTMDGAMVVCLPGRDALAFVNTRDGTISRYDPATDATTELYRRDSASVALGSFVLARSPDGSEVAFVVRDAEQSRLMVLPTGGGEAREIMALPNHPYPNGWRGNPTIVNAAWMPDGEHLLVVRLAEAPEHSPTERPIPYELWLVPRHGGPARFVDTLPEEFHHGGDEPGFVLLNLDVHPDGHMITFDRRHGFVEQVWAIDHLLPHLQRELVP